MSRTRSKRQIRGAANGDQEQMKLIFERCDADKDGYLNKQELKKALGDLGVEFPNLRAISALWHADANEDGNISKNELAELVKYTSTLSTVRYSHRR